MKPQSLMLAAAAALLLLPRRVPAAPIRPTPAAPRVDYANPTAAAAAAAARALVNILPVSGFRATPTPASEPNPTQAREDARNAVRAGDDYYGSGAVAWYAANAEEARAAVRAGDDYYGTAYGWGDVP